MTEQSFDEYKQIMRRYDSDLWLGFLAWYSISEESYIDHGKLCHLLVSNGLSTHLPPVPRPSDVFKRCCTAAQRKKVPTAQPMVFENYLIREVGKDLDNIWRRIVREQVDTEGHTLGYEELVELHFHRPTTGLNINFLTNDPAQNTNPTVVGIINEISHSMAKLNNAATPYAIRSVVRKTLMGMNATEVRASGGVYFVRATYANEVAAMEKVITALPGGSTFHSIPLIDDGKQRQMLRHAFEEESIGAIDGLLGEISDILKQGTKITSDKFADFKSQYDGLKRKVVDYSDLLDEALEATASRLEIMENALFTLLGQVRT